MEGMKGVKGLLSLAKNDFVSNSKDLKQDFKDILEMARTKRRSKQETKPLSALDAKINPDAGAELLSHYRHQWASIHKSIQSASEVAKTVDAMVTEVEEKSRSTKVVVAKCQGEFAELPSVLSGVQRAHEKVLKIEECLKKVEDAIMEYCQVAAKAEAYEKKRAETAALGAHRIERQLEFERYKLSLTEEQRLLTEERAKHEQEKLQERQRNYGELFENEMSKYIKNGGVERSISGSDQGTSLDQITIDDPESADTLDQFLRDVGPDEVAVNAEGTLEGSLESRPDAAVDKRNETQQDVAGEI